MAPPTPPDCTIGVFSPPVSASGDLLPPFKCKSISTDFLSSLEALSKRLSTFLRGRGGGTVTLKGLSLPVFGESAFDGSLELETDVSFSF